MMLANYKQADDARAMLVYQTGIANVFQVDCFNVNAAGREERRILQADFRTCENFCRGLGAAGVVVRSVYCNMAGDVARQNWCEDLDDAPFRESMNPAKCN